MPKITIPLVMNPNQRGYGNDITMSKDAIMSGVVPLVVTDELKGSKSVYTQKRTGMTGSSSLGANIFTALFVSPSVPSAIISAFGSSTSTIYKSVTSQGSLDIAGTGYVAAHITETVIAGITYWLISSHTGAMATTAGWYLASDAGTVTAYTGDTHSNTTIDNIAPSTAGMYIGQAIAGTGIPANTRIATITSGTAITITQAATATAAGVALTKTPVALILDSDFPTLITGAFVELNGRIFIMRQNGEIYQSDLNSVTSWGASNYVPTDLTTDVGVGLARYKNTIVAVGSGGAEMLENVGNPAGSVLLSRQGSAISFGSFRSPNSGTPSLIANDLYRVAWISKGGPQCGVYLMDDSGIRNVASGAVAKLLDTGLVALSISLFSRWGLSFVHVATNVDGARNLLYCIDVGLWVDANFPASFIVSGAPVAAVNFVTNGVPVSGSSGVIYTFNNSIYQDALSNYSWTITTENYSLNNGEPFIITHIDLIGDTESSGSVTITASEDDYQNFAGLGTFDLTQAVKRVDGCGYYPSTVAFKLTETANRQFRAQALNVYWQPCGRPN